MSKAEESAQAIYQRLLDKIGAAIVEKDRGKYTNFFSLPHHLQTFEKVVVITDVAQLNHYFDKLVERLSDLGVSELTRYCIVAEFVDEDTIQGHHDTKLINRSLVILEDYVALSTLKRTDGSWKVSASQYAEAEPSIPTQITD